MKQIFLLLAIASAFILHGTGALASCVTLAFTASGDDGYEGQAAIYDLRISAQPITELNWAQATSYKHVPIPRHAGEAETIRVSGLMPGWRYYFAIRVGDELSNWSDLSNVIWKVAPEETCIGLVGNADCDANDAGDLMDILMIASYAFMGGPLPCCYTEANVDQDPNGIIDLNDVLLLANYVYMGRGQLPDCPWLP